MTKGRLLLIFPFILLKRVFKGIFFGELQTCELHSLVFAYELTSSTGPREIQVGTEQKDTA